MASTTVRCWSLTLQEAGNSAIAIIQKNYVLYWLTCSFLAVTLYTTSPAYFRGFTLIALKEGRNGEKEEDYAGNFQVGVCSAVLHSMETKINSVNTVLQWGENYWCVNGQSVFALDIKYNYSFMLRQQYNKKNIKVSLVVQPVLLRNRAWPRQCAVICGQESKTA